jgi:hypothetical protein
MSRLSVARKELRQASEALTALRVAQNFKKLDECWVRFLHNIERTWNKMRAEMKNNTKWTGWPERGHIERLRKEDPLLSYLRNARGAEEHGLADITVKKGGSVAIRAADMSKWVYIEVLRWKSGE